MTLFIGSLINARFRKEFWASYTRFVNRRRWADDPETDKVTLYIRGYGTCSEPAVPNTRGRRWTEATLAPRARLHESNTVHSHDLIDASAALILFSSISAMLCTTTRDAVEAAAYALITEAEHLCELWRRAGINLAGTALCSLVLSSTVANGLNPVILFFESIEGLDAAGRPLVFYPPVPVPAPAPSLEHLDLSMPPSKRRRPSKQVASPPLADAESDPIPVATPVAEPAADAQIPPLACSIGESDLDRWIVANPVSCAPAAPEDPSLDKDPTREELLAVYLDAAYYSPPFSDFANVPLG